MPIELNLLKAEALTPILAAMAGDRNAVAADRIQTGLDRTVSSAAAVTATAARDAALLSRGVFASTAAGLSNGVVNVTGLVGGTGGANGTFALAFTGGAGVNAAGVFTVAGGIVTQVTITNPGTGYTSAPVISFAASAGLVGASATAVIGARNPVGTYFSVAETSRELILYRVDAGPVAIDVGRYATTVALRNIVPLGLEAFWRPADTLPVNWYDTLDRLTIGAAQRSVIRNYPLSQLFENGEAGIWIDPSDRSTLFQDAAGTIPVTAYGQPVGRVLDKSGRGNHLTQAVSAARPIYAREPKGGARNRLIRTEDFAHASWVKLGLGVVGNALIEDASTGLHRISQGASAVPGQIHRFSALVQRTSGTRNLEIGLIVAGGYTTYRIDLGTGAIISSDNVVGSALSAPAVTVVAEGSAWRVTLTVTIASATTCTVLAGLTNTPNNTYAGDGASGISISQPQFEIGARTNYQAVVTAADVTEVGQPSCDYLSFDGVDDSLVTAAALPFSTTVFAMVGFKIAAWPQDDVHVLTHRFGGPQNQPAVFAAQAGSNIGFGWDNYPAAGSFGGPGMQIRRDVLAYSWANGTARLLDVNGVRNTADGPIMVQGATSPIVIGGGTSFKFAGNFYGSLQINRVPTITEIAHAQAYMASRIPQGVAA